MKTKEFCRAWISLKPSKSGIEHGNVGAKAEEPNIQGLPGLQCDFKASLGNLARLGLKIKSIKRSWKELRGTVLAWRVCGPGLNPSA